MANFFPRPRPFGGRRPPYGSHSSKALRKNDRIRVPEVRVIGPDGKQIGVMATREAQRLAQTHGLDLVEVSPGSRPPVCRVIDYGKYMYDVGKKQKDGHKPHTSKLKEVKLRPRIEQHDYLTKLRHAEEFLYDGNKVKLTLFFRGREMEHKELGFETVARAIKDLEHVGLPDFQPRLMGRNIILTLSPLPLNRRKLKLNEPRAPAPPGGDKEPSPHDSGTSHHVDAHEDEDSDEDEADDHDEVDDDEAPPPTGAATSLGEALAAAKKSSAPPPPPAAS